MNEFQLIEWIQKKSSSSGFPGVALGIGDDAAVLKVPRGERLVVTTDAIVEGVDFLRSAPARQVGHKALAINLSDLAAMGAKPYAYLVTLGIPPTSAESWIHGFYDGLLALGKKYGVACVGGDLSSARQFFASVTLFGFAKPNVFVTRSGARPGDLIAVTGRLGGSITGKHLSFEPRVREGEWLAKLYRPSAMIDISDGLWQDLAHLLKASKVGAAVDLGAIPISRPVGKLARGNAPKALRHALTDGEDFELLFTVSPRDKRPLERDWRRRFPKTPLTWIGKITSDAGKIRWYEGAQTVKLHFEHKGYQHF